ncbi:hypothetical protein PAXINDRAFT_8007 [Paxillus involutus ATCC 200175]|nr:hypothetical protein PAXINDRAFT_8007 [Paxillus involutus ATCC 200175]
MAFNPPEGPQHEGRGVGFDGLTEDRFEGAAQTFGRGQTFMDKVDADQFSHLMKENLYYPFASRSEWKFALWLLHSGLSMSAIDDFLSLGLVQKLSLSFHTAKDLCYRVDHAGGQWKFQSPSCIQQSPPSISRFHSLPCLSGDNAWEMQIPEGATLLGTILSSDKMNITTLSGSRVAHPLLIGLANIKMSTRLKLSLHSLMLTALLPVPKFIHKNKCMRGLLEDRLIHQCLDIVLDPLKRAARLGTMLPDSMGLMWYCFTPIASYIADMPEAMMLAAVGGKTSPLTMAMLKQFRDPFQHEPRTRTTTLAQLSAAKSKVDPANIEAFFCEAQHFRLNRVSGPFWMDYPLSCPGSFLTPELLHHLHKQFWDHDAKWCINVVGDAKIDFRFSVLQPVAGFRHFKGSITKLKQVTGCVHRDVQHYMVAIISGPAPAGIVTAIHTLMDFQYRIQAYRIDDNDLQIISAALSEFHANKDSIIEHGAWRDQEQKAAINNWYIPKLELMQSIVLSIHRVGVVIQFTVDITEHAHSMEIKIPAGSSNNNNYILTVWRSAGVLTS